jgi:hypothetical protein
MAITLLNYYDQYSEGNNTGLYSQPGGPTIPNPNNPIIIALPNMAV